MKDTKQIRKSLNSAYEKIWQKEDRKKYKSQEEKLEKH